MRVIPTKIPDLLVIEPKVHRDARGFFVETFSDRWDLPFRFVQDNHSMSTQKGTLRGLHYQRPPAAQTKLIRCLRGAIFDVAVDLREGSPTYGHWVGETLTAENMRQLLVPKGFAHGFCTLEDMTEVAYKVDHLYSPEHDGSIRWDDSDISIQWPMKHPSLSPKDEMAPTLKELQARKERFG